MVAAERSCDARLHRLVRGQRVGVGNSAFELAVDLLELLDALLFYGWVAQGAALARLDDARDGAVREARGLVDEDLGGRGDDWGHLCCRMDVQVVSAASEALAVAVLQVSFWGVQWKRKGYERKLWGLLWLKRANPKVSVKPVKQLKRILGIKQENRLA